MPIKKSIYLTDDILKKLDEVIKSNPLLQEANAPQYTKAIIYIIEHYNENNTNIELSKIAKMVEQINVAIPHLMYSSYFTYKINEGTLSDQKFKEFRNYTLQNIAQSCGQIQHQDYDNVHISFNKNNMKTIPIEEENNQWK